MKRTVILSVLAISSAFCATADTIVFKDGHTLEVYNVEESGRWVLYTVGPEADAELKRVDAAQVFAIKATDGEMKMIGQSGPQIAQQQAPAAEQNAPRMLDPIAAADNADLINAYNSAEIKLKKPRKEKDKTKYCTDFIPIWGVGSESVLSDSNVAISFKMEYKPVSFYKIFSYYKIAVTNKTSAPIYIDLANSFKVSANGEAKPYFTNSIYTEGSARNRGAAVNLGAVAGALGVSGTVGTLASGVAVGGGNSNTASISSEEQRFIMIPPKSTVYMPPVRFSDGSNILEQYECLYFRTTELSSNVMSAENDLRRYSQSKPFVNAMKEEGIDDGNWTRDKIAAPLGWTRSFEESVTPKKITRLISYSTTPDFMTYTTLPVTLFVRAVMGSSKSAGVPNGYDPDEMECFDEAHLLFGVGHVEKQ